MTTTGRVGRAGTAQPDVDLVRRLVAEMLGTALLLVAVVGSGIMATRLSPDDVGLQLLENAVATSGALIALILVFGAVSGAHFNPAVTLVNRLFGTLSTLDAALYTSVQVVGGCLGALVANVLFERPTFEWSTKVRSSAAVRLSEVVATFGLLLVIHGCVRAGRAAAVPFAVGAWIGGAYWFTSSTSFANPAATVARTLSDSFAGIDPASAPMFIGMQTLGALLAFGVVRFLYAAPPVSAHRTMSSAHDPTISARPSVLFVCVHNAGRSQMAAGWLRHMAGDRVAVYSGGSEPAAHINPAAAAAMAEVGIDITREVPKLSTDAIVETADVVVTMGCGDTCKFFPGKRYEDWNVADPAGLDLASVRPIRDEIQARVEQLVSSLGAGVR